MATLLAKQTYNEIEPNLSSSLDFKEPMSEVTPASILELGVPRQEKRFFFQRSKVRTFPSLLVGINVDIIKANYNPDAIATQV